MHRLRFIGAIVLAILGTAAAAPAQPDFEALSIRPAAPGKGGGDMLGILNGGPGTRTPERITYRGATLIQLVRKAYDLEYYQVTAPDWFGRDLTAAERYDIAGTVSPGTTAEQFKLMHLKVLKERFGLVFHWEQKEFPAYELARGKGALKLAESDSTEQQRGMMSPLNGGWQMKATAVPISALTNFLAMQFKSPVADLTGLTGKYTFQTDFAINPAAGADGVELPSVFTAMEELGLKLTRIKKMLDVLVVDKVNKTPTEN